MSNDSAVHALVREHGRETTSFQVLGSAYKHWLDRDGCVAFTEVGNSWITVGGAIAPEHRELEVIEGFAQEAHRRGKRVRFFGLERDVSRESSLETIHIGDQPAWDPGEWPRNLSKKLREQLRRARTKGIVTTRLATAEEIEDPEHPTRRGVDAVIQRWLESRRAAPMGFLIALDPFHRLRERRVFVAETPERGVVGVMVALPIYARNGWFIDNMLRAPDAPNGTVELMFDCAMRTFADEGSSYVTLGLSPFVGVSSKFVQFIRDTFGALYNFKGLHAFKTKLRPASWQPVYIAYPKRERGVSAVLDMVAVFLPGGWLRFAWDSMIQRANTTAGLAGLALAPWTALTALAPARWFPSPTAQGAWVTANLVLMATLFNLFRRWRRGLALLLTALLTAHVAAGGLQLAAHNATQARLSDWPWLLASLAGPAFLAAWAWASRDRASLYTGPLAVADVRAPELLPERVVPQTKPAAVLGELRAARLAERTDAGIQPSIGSSGV